MRSKLIQALVLLMFIFSLDLAESCTSMFDVLSPSLNGKLTELVVGVKISDQYSCLMKIARDLGVVVKNVVYLNGSIEAVVVKLPLSEIGKFNKLVREIVKPVYVEPNVLYKACFVPNDRYWSFQWGFKKIRADFAWNVTRGNSSILIAIVDTGVDWDHPDLAANYVPLGYDWVNNDHDPMDDNGHGTHVAGIVAAVINNSIGVAGLSQVRIMAEKGLNASGYGFADDLANAINHAVDSGAKIIVMSWGDYESSILLYNAIKYAYRAGALLVAAAGNDATSDKMYPAAYDEVVAVSATDSSDDLASFSNYGDWIELSAPGVNIISTYWDNTYRYESGTSMAAPFIAGVAALTWSVYPNLSRDDLRTYLHATTDDLGAPGFDIYYGFGRVNAEKAVKNLTSIHDIAVDSVVPRKSVVGEGMKMRIDANITNLGNTTESFVADLYANSTKIESLSSVLLPGQTVTLTFQWNTTGFNKGRYVISCLVNALPEEFNVSNNAKNSGFMVTLALIGDITGLNDSEPDGRVDIKDVALVAISYGASLGDPKWNANADINDDDKIDIRDVSMVASNYGKFDP